jgi:uncharacterized Zn-binding protein involved in type VI secretion
VSQIDALQAGPQAAAWSVDWSSKRSAWIATANTWVVVAAVAPTGAAWSVPYRKVTTCSSPKGRCETTTQALRGHALALPATVTVGGRPAARLGTKAASGCPAWPGEAVWCAQVPGPGTYAVTATWARGQTAIATITLQKGS